MKGLLVLGVIGIAAGIASGTAAQERGVSSDYRKRAAQIIKSRTNYRIRDGRISRPSVMWAGLLASGNLPGVCAVIFRENPFGMVVRETWQITFKNGAIATADYANIACDHTSKFPEVLGR